MRKFRKKLLCMAISCTLALGTCLPASAVSTTSNGVAAILPLSYVCAFMWHLHPIALYAVLSVDEFIKLPPAFIRYRRYKWLKNITRDFT